MIVILQATPPAPWLMVGLCCVGGLQVGDASWGHTTTLCNPNITGSVAACFDSSIDVVGNYDFRIPDAPEIAYPTNGDAWGFHITPSSGGSYIISW